MTIFRGDPLPPRRGPSWLTIWFVALGAALLIALAWREIAGLVKCWRWGLC